MNGLPRVISSDFHCNTHLAAWHGEWNDDLEGSFGIWQHVIEVADECQKVVGAEYSPTSISMIW